MKKVLIMTSLVFVLLFQTYSIGSIYGQLANIDTNSTLLGNTDSTMEDDISNQLESASGGVILGSAVNASNFKFEDIIAEGKSTLLNVLDIKPYTPIKYNTISCLLGQPFLYSQQGRTYEVDCSKVVVIGQGNPGLVNNQQIYKDTPAVASSLLTVVSQGIEKPIRSCFIQETSTATEGISMLDCTKLYILYK